MNKRKYKRIFPKLGDVSEKIVDAATYVVDNEYKTESGDSLKGDLRTGFIINTSITMAIGENLSKRKYIMKGFILGSTITLGGVIIMGAQKIKEEKRKARHYKDFEKCRKTQE